MRYRIPSKNENHEVSVGWDRPMRTHFAQVHDQTITDERKSDLIFWLGGNFDEFPEMAPMLEKLQPYADVPETVKALMEFDKKGGTLTYHPFNAPHLEIQENNLKERTVRLQGIIALNQLTQSQLNTYASRLLGEDTPWYWEVRWYDGHPMYAARVVERAFWEGLIDEQGTPNWEELDEAATLQVAKSYQEIIEEDFKQHLKS